MTSFRALSRVLLTCDLRDLATLIFTFVVPPALLVALVVAFGDLPSSHGGDSVDEVSANVVSFGTAFVGIYAGATHLAGWRENGMIRVLRMSPTTPGTILGAQAAVGVGFAVAQAALLVAIGSLPWLGMTPAPTAVLALVGVVLGYLVFFFLGVLLANWVRSMSAVSMLASIVIVPLGFVGGAMMPIETLPGWMRDIAGFTPLYHLREVILFPLVHVGGWSATSLGCLYLAGVAAGLYALVRSVMRWA